MILGRELSLSVHGEPHFRNLSMGIFDGLTDDEARTRDPLAMARLEAWRQGSAKVEDIKIPEAENLIEFVRRVGIGLQSIKVISLNPIIIITRSLGIAIVNILTGYLAGHHAEYLRYRFDTGSITRMLNSATSWNIAIENDTSYLVGHRDFKDD